MHGKNMWCYFKQMCQLILTISTSWISLSCYAIFIGWTIFSIDNFYQVNHFMLLEHFSGFVT